jgi:hypothetical protein
VATTKTHHSNQNIQSNSSSMEFPLRHRIEHHTGPPHAQQPSQVNQKYAKMPHQMNDDSQMTLCYQTWSSVEGIGQPIPRCGSSKFDNCLHKVFLPNYMSLDMPISKVSGEKPITPEASHVRGHGIEST